MCLERRWHFWRVSVCVCCSILTTGEAFWLTAVYGLHQLVYGHLLSTLAFLTLLSIVCRAVQLALWFKEYLNYSLRALVSNMLVEQWRHWKWSLLIVHETSSPLIVPLVESVANLALQFWCLSLILLLCLSSRAHRHSLYTATSTSVVHFADQSSSTGTYLHCFVFSPSILCNHHRNPEVSRPAQVDGNRNKMAPAQKKPVIFVIGGPGSGKGTVCDKIKAK